MQVLTKYLVCYLTQKSQNFVPILDQLLDPPLDAKQCEYQQLDILVLQYQQTFLPTLHLVLLLNQAEKAILKILELKMTQSHHPFQLHEWDQSLLLELSLIHI